MGRISFVSALILLGMSAAAQAQAAYDSAPLVSSADVAFGYNYIRANAPPGGAPKFNAHGGFASIAINWKYWLSIVGEVSGTHANDISVLGQNLTLLTYAGGPRIDFHVRRTVVFVQGLVGAAHGSDSYFPTSSGYTTSANSLAYSAGGGVDYGLSSRWAVRLQGQYLHTAFPNGVNDSEHHLSVGAAVVYRIHRHLQIPEGHKFTASQVQAMSPTPAPSPERPAVPEPAASSTPVAASVAEPVSAPSITMPNGALRDNVKDVLFDYDSSALRPDTKQTVTQVADYLKTHPGVRVLIGGYSDERGTTEYNLALGDRRAAATRDALVTAGIDSARVSTISYGKGEQVCTQDDEACWQRNRRAVIMIHP